MQKSGRERGTNDPKAADRKKHAVPKEPRQADPASVRQGRPSADKGDLTVQRESVAPVKHRGGDENIVRVKTGVDRPMLVLVLLLLSLGSIMVFSASYPSALAQEGDSLFYIKKQLLFVAIGLTFMIGLSYLPPKFYKTFTVALFAFAVFLLVIVLIPGIGISNGEARRWLGLKGTSFTFQPSEIMKVALVMMLAWYLDKYQHTVTDCTDKKQRFWRGTLVPCLFVGIACGLVMLEKHLSGMIIMGAIGLCVMFIGGVHFGWMMTVAGVGGLSAIAAFLAANPYAWKRITSFADENADKLDEAWQTTQGLYAIGSGGALGVGLGASRQKYSYVSEAQNDFIFTIWCEELGFVGAVTLIILFLLFIWRGYVIAMRAPDTYSALVVFGIISQVGIQAFLNIGVVTDVLPNTGIALPFFSYGGTSLIILLMEMGVVLSISKHSYQKK